MKCTLIREMDCVPCLDFPSGKKPAGTLIDHPEAFRLVQHGVADPADEECAARHGLSPAELFAAKAAYERVSRGIHPEDYADFDAGVMTGYDSEGNPLPGPNYVAADTDDADADEEDLV